MSSIIMPRGIIKPPDLSGYWPLNGEKLSGLDLFDSGAGGFEGARGVDGWVVVGTNTIEVSTDKAHGGTKSAKITYVDDTQGAVLDFSDATDLITDLTIGKKYRCKLWAAVNGGSVDVRIYDGTGFTSPITVTSTSMVPLEFDFIANHATNADIRMNNMGATEIIYIDDITLQELYTPDVSGLGNHGTVNGGVTVAQGKFGGCYEFDGVAGSYIDCGDIADYTDNFTIMAWIKPNSGVENVRLFSRRGATTQYDAYLGSGGGVGKLNLYDGASGFVRGNDLRDDLWHHAALKINGANSCFLTDGLQAGAVFNPTIISRSEDFEIGSLSSGSSGNWDGFMDELKIFNRVLTEAQIRYEMYRGSPFRPVLNGGVLWPN